MAKSRISTIIAVYNGESFLAEAIQSVLDQTLPPMELIVVDDGSIDGTAQIARSFDSVRYQYQENGGQPAALNHGVQLAQGEYFAFLDADDVWMPNKLELQLAALHNDPSLDMVFGHAKQFVDENAPAEVAASLSLSRRILPAHLPAAMLIRRTAFKRVGGFHGRWKVGNVVDWYARAMEMGLKARTLDEVIYRRRIHGSNTGVQQRQSQADYLAVVKAALDRRRKNAEKNKNDRCE